MGVKMEKGIVQELFNQKADLEEANVNDFQKIKELQRNRLKRIVKLDVLENKLREFFDRKRINRGKIR